MVLRYTWYCSARSEIQVRTRLEQKSDMRLQEVYEEAEVAGVTIPIPARVQVCAWVIRVSS